MRSTDNGRGWTFETLLAHVQSKLDDNDRRYQELRDADKSAIASALSASEKAIEKSQGAQDRVNQNQNELRGMAEDQAKRHTAAVALLPSRGEFEATKERIAKLESIYAGMAGSSDQRRENLSGNRWTIGTVISVAFGLAGFLFALFALFQTLKGRP